MTEAAIPHARSAEDDRAACQGHVAALRESYDVIWDGSHQDADRDLLCTERIAEKRRHVVLSRRRTVCLARRGGAITRVEQALSDAPGSCRDVEERAGLSHGAVQAAIFELRRMGAIVVQGSRKVKGMGRYETVYGPAPDIFCARAC